MPGQQDVVELRCRKQRFQDGAMRSPLAMLTIGIQSCLKNSNHSVQHTVPARPAFQLSPEAQCEKEAILDLPDQPVRPLTTTELSRHHMAQPALPSSWLGTCSNTVVPSVAFWSGVLGTSRNLSLHLTLPLLAFLPCLCRRGNYHTDLAKWIHLSPTLT